MFYLVFRFAITKFDLKTPGREDDDDATEMKIELGNNDYTGTASLARTNVFKGETVAIAVSSYGHEDTPPYTVYRGTLALTATFELFPPPGCRINETGAVICTAE